ncbi:PAS-domain containing protein [Paracoccus spongiarum]|uniref:PAS-domain containing protein n=1 Tax=Paracoccus spongiarum TaxID=3064387 RepID=A0ABT9JB01_9RHOB|nr:PAS-domain containing protein [Paracoccus sp. 2205BS29-5]MDP5306982.1 PAS-domain containing protein [Paracoccus sp. 2205BS29-5]
MLLVGFENALTALVAGTASVCLALALMRLWDRLRGGRRGALGHDRLQPGLQPMIFLFRRQRLVDVTAPGRTLLDRVAAPDDEWGRLQRWIGPRFELAGERLDQLARQGRVELVGRHGIGSAALRLLAEDLGDDLIRITLTDPEAEQAGIVVDSMAQQAMEEELDLLRRALDQTPMLVWRQDAEDRVTWANAAYLRRAETLDDGSGGWPLPRLLDTPKPVPGAGTTTRRAPLDSNGVISWYDCHSHRMGDETMMFALPADAAVRAERSLREFVQTLTKTFADLPIGLAIFDRQRNLQLFNPALIDLTGLPTGFLTARPTLFDLLDKLRELRMVPEPKDYRSWRQQMSNLESAAATGHHVETWSLPGGQTYRVTGRPHPDGAVAFLFEDITSEISLTRKFRAELQLGAHVLDGLDDALAVFGPDGKVLVRNRAYLALWGDGAETLGAALAAWQDRAAPGPGFAALRARLTGHDEARRDSGAMAGPDGRLLRWSVTGLGGGRQMLRLSTPDIAADTGPERDDYASAMGAG